MTPITEHDLAELMTVSQAARFIGVSQRSIYRMVQNRELRVVRIGSGKGQLRLTKSDLLDHINRKSA